jgi:hypothetical protein
VTSARFLCLSCGVFFSAWLSKDANSLCEMGVKSNSLCDMGVGSRARERRLRRGGGMLILFETPAGYALFQAKDDSKFTEVDDIVKAFESGDSANKAVKLKAFQKFDDTSEALVRAPPVPHRPFSLFPPASVENRFRCWICVRSPCETCPGRARRPETPGGRERRATRIAGAGPCALRERLQTRNRPVWPRIWVSQALSPSGQWGAPSAPLLRARNNSAARGPGAPVARGMAT